MMYFDHHMSAALMALLVSLSGLFGIAAINADMMIAASFIHSLASSGVSRFPLASLICFHSGQSCLLLTVLRSSDPLPPSHCAYL